jgi:flagellar biosynthesis protein FlhG
MTASKQNIIAIASGKGGVGKTWLSITLAQLFARAGRRVCLFDGDVGLANIDVQLGIAPPQDLSEIFTQQAHLRDIAYPYEDGGFDIIPGRSGSGDMANLPEPALQTLRTQLNDIAEDYDYVVMDLGAGIERNVRFLASLADRVLVVLTDEPTSLTDAYAFIKLCLQHGQHQNIQVVVNQASTQKEGEKIFGAIEKACQNFLNFKPELMGVIRKDNKVRETIRSQTPMLKKAPSATAATDAAAISVKLMQPKKVSA